MKKANKILMVTGKLAEKSIQRYVAKSKRDVEVKVIPVSVAAFMTPEMIAREMKNVNSKDYSMMIVPGLARYDLRDLEKMTGIPTFRGCKYAADIPVLLDNVDEVELSKDVPACELLKSKIAEAAQAEISRIEKNAEKSSEFSIGKVPIGKNSPIRIIAEIADAPLLKDEEIIETVSRFIEEGAEIIDIGMTADEPMPEKVPHIVSLIREKFDVPVSIDSMDEAEIRAAIDSKVDLILSLNMELVDKFPGLEVPVVLVPVDAKTRRRPKSPSEKVDNLLRVVNRARELGYKRIIADPILEPVNFGFAESLVTFYELRKAEPSLPIIIGVGNVIELFDADSIGMVALLTGVASEVGVELVLTVEGSDKTRGNVAEIRQARDMMSLAKSRGSVPKDLGVDLLRLKEKNRVLEDYDRKVEGEAKVLKAKPSSRFNIDAQKIYRIYIDRGEIVVVVYRRKKPDIVVRGKTAEDVCSAMFKDPEIEHVAYLGRELQKAETALKTGKGYLQDKELF